MAVFLLNTCKFNGCGLDFSTLQELIYHIEDTHLDFEPKNTEENEFKQTSCMPVSYIFRLFSGEYNQSAIKSSSCNTNLNVTLNSRKDSGSELDEENYESESEKSSIDSWSNNSIESDSNSILKIINPATTVVTKDDSDKPYICQFSNCKKRYRNSNGLKYHTKSVHTDCGLKKELATPKLYKCHCDKNYKTPYGLKNHAKTCSVNLSNSNPIGKISEMKLNLNNSKSDTSNNNNNGNNNTFNQQNKQLTLNNNNQPPSTASQTINLKINSTINNSSINCSTNSATLSSSNTNNLNQITSIQLTNQSSQLNETTNVTNLNLNESMKINHNHSNNNNNTHQLQKMNLMI